MSAQLEHLPAVLIADDDPDDLFFTRRLFQQAGIENPVVTVEDGEEAIDFLSGCIDTGHLPCLVLLDIKMPRRCGFDVLDWARRQPALANVAFVVLSGSSLHQDMERAADAGAAYLVKYATPEQLTQLMRERCPAVIHARTRGLENRKP